MPKRERFLKERGCNLQQVEEARAGLPRILKQRATDVKGAGLFREIRECPKTDSCWGERRRSYEPVIVPCRVPRVMIVSEQPGTGKLLKDIKLGEGISGLIDELFDHRLLRDFNKKTEEFGEFYWTHYIKCPGNFRHRQKGKSSKTDLDACAKKWLEKEIRTLKPKLVVTFGAKASTFVLKMINDRNILTDQVWEQYKWTDRVWEQFKWVIEDEQVKDVEIDNLKFKLIVALHPSRKNGLARPFNKKIQTLISKCLKEP